MFPYTSRADLSWKLEEAAEPPPPMKKVASQPSEEASLEQIVESLILENQRLIRDFCEAKVLIQSLQEEIAEIAEIASQSPPELPL